MREVAIIGVGITKFGELWDASFRDLGIEAGMKAMNDANLTGSEVDGMFIGNMSSGSFIAQHHISALIADYSGMASRNVPSTRVEAAGASGGVAFRQAVMAVASGMHDIVVVGGAEKMTDVSDEAANSIMDSATDQQWEALFGATFPSLYAMIARRFIHEGIATREEIASMAVNSHAHGALNPDAQFKKAITLDTVLRSSMVSDPLTVFDCAPISDGAAAVVLCPLDTAKKYNDRPVKVVASAQASDSLALFQRKDITTFSATAAAAKHAYSLAKIKAKDISVAEVHDHFTIEGIMALQDLGLFKKGEAGKAVKDGQAMIGGKVAVNTSGGLKARGNPIGATGVAQIVEIAKQLRGDADKRQVKDARYGLAQNSGGTGSTVVVNIMEAL
jgi:acetyl-CoA C-acetyltransferase